VNSSRAEQGRAGQGRAGQGRAGQGRAGHVGALSQVLTSKPVTVPQDTARALPTLPHSHRLALPIRDQRGSQQHIRRLLLPAEPLLPSLSLFSSQYTTTS
jgi:hypothetical protein